MAWHDEIADKRLVYQADTVLKARHSEGLGAIQHSESTVSDALRDVAKSSDIKQLCSEVEYFAKATIYAAKVADDRTAKLADKFDALIESFTNNVKDLDSSGRNRELLTAFNNFSVVLGSFKEASQDKDKATLAAIEGIADATKAIKVTVAAPKVNVTVPEMKMPDIKVPAAVVDFKPLIAALTKTEPVAVDLEDKLDLSEYRAQDLEDLKHKQYIGFLHPTGAWYIIENDTKGNQLRYVFGDTDYSDAWDNASSYAYRLLNEAVNAL